MNGEGRKWTCITKGSPSTGTTSHSPSEETPQHLFTQAQTIMSQPVFKIEVFNALQTLFPPSKYISFKLKQTFTMRPRIENEDITWSPQYMIICPPQQPTSLGHCYYKKKWTWMVDSSFFTLYWKHVPYNSCTSSIWVDVSFLFLYAWIDVLDLNQPFNWSAKMCHNNQQA